MMKVRRIGFLMFFVCAALTMPSVGAITGSAHDFSNAGWNTTGEICAPCHVPHNADMTVVNAPLWSHEVTTQTFVLYSSPTFDGSSTAGQPSGTSKLCLSCHDGTIALDNFAGFVGGTNYIQDPYNLGTDLSDSHPISFTYDTTLATADGGLFDPSTHNSGLGGTIADDLLHQNKLECSSCHDVHDEAGVGFLLVKSNAGSALCLTCHDK